MHRFLSCSALMTCLVPMASAQVLTSMTNHVGVTAPGASVWIGDASADLQVLVGTLTLDLNDPYVFTPFKWSAASGMVMLPMPPGAASAHVWRMRDDGEVLFIYSYAPPVDEFRTSLYRWTASEGFTLLVGENTGQLSGVYNISRDGLTLVGAVYGPSADTATYRPYRWSLAGGLQYLRPNVPEQYAIATLASADGEVVAGLESTLFPGVFRWTSATGFHMLPPLQGWPRPTQPVIFPAWMSSDGNVLYGNAASLDPWGMWNGYQGGFRWSPQTGTLYIPLEQRAMWGYTELVGVTPDERWLFGSGGTDQGAPDFNNQHAYVWRADGSAVDLDDYFASQSQHPEWVLRSARFMSDDHQSVIGEAVSEGKPFHWIATLPNTFPCDSIDFNNDGSLLDPQDIDAFFSVYSEGPCIPLTATCNDIDFNNDTSVFDPCDINSFLVVYSEGPCTPCGV